MTVGEKFIKNNKNKIIDVAKKVTEEYKGVLKKLSKF
jgi:hypothetical protein